MPFKIQCTCGRVLTAPDSLAGKKARCPACKRVIPIPTPKPTPPEKPAESATPPPSPPPAGSQPLRPPGEMTELGDGSPDIEPRPPGASTFGVKMTDSGDQSAPPQGPPPDGVGEGIPNVEPRPPGASTFGLKVPEASKEREVHARALGGQVCPFCHEPREADAVLCTNCGLNFQTGDRLNTERQRPDRVIETKNILLVALDMVYRPFQTVDALGGYVQNPKFMLYMWLFVVATLCFEAGTLTAVRVVQQGQADARVAQRRGSGRQREPVALGPVVPPDRPEQPVLEGEEEPAEAPEIINRVSSGAVRAHVMFPAMFIWSVAMLAVSALFFYLAGMIFGIRSSFLQLFLYLGFVSGVVSIAGIAALIAALTSLEISIAVMMLIAFGIWRIVLYVAVLSRCYDLNAWLAAAIGLIALILRNWFGGYFLEWLRGALGT